MLKKWTVGGCLTTPTSFHLYKEPINKKIYLTDRLVHILCLSHDGCACWSSFLLECPIPVTTTNGIRAFPQFIKISMFSLILMSGIPFQYQISKIKTISFSSFVKHLFDLILIAPCFITESFPDLMYLH